MRMAALSDIGHGAAAILGHHKLVLNVPMWDLEKWEIFKLVEDLNRTVEVLGDTYSCLKHDADLRHQWGHGCGSCDGCVRRWRAWEKHLHEKES